MLRRKHGGPTNCSRRRIAANASLPSSGSKRKQQRTHHQIYRRLNHTSAVLSLTATNRQVERRSKMKKNAWIPLPLDMIALMFSPIIISVVTILSMSLLWPVLRGGVLSVFLTAVAAGIVGVVLLFFARVPLYRSGQFFSFGTGSL